MDSNLWSLLHIVFPLCLCGLQNDIIYVYLEEGRPFYLYSIYPDIGYNCTTPVLIGTNVLEHVHSTSSDSLGPSPWPSVFKCMSAHVKDFDVSVKTSKAYTVPAGSGLFITGIVHAPVFCGKMTVTANAPDSPLGGSVVLTPCVLSLAPGTSRVSLEVKNHGKQAVKIPAKTYATYSNVLLFPQTS